MPNSTPNSSGDKKQIDPDAIGVWPACMTLVMLSGVFVLGYSLLVSAGYFALVGFVVVGLLIRFVPQRGKLAPGVNEFSISILWVVVLPLLCLAYVESFFLAPEEPMHWIDYLAIFMLFQMLIFLVWIFAGPQHPVWSGFVYGFLLPGEIASCVVSLVVLPPSALLAFAVGCGLPGFVPLVAFILIRKHLLLAHSRWEETPSAKFPFRRAMLAGLICSMFFPFAYLHWGAPRGLPYRLPRVDLMPFADYAWWKRG